MEARKGKGGVIPAIHCPDNVEWRTPSNAPPGLALDPGNTCRGDASSARVNRPSRTGPSRPPVPGVDSGTTGDTPMEIVGQLVQENEDINNLGLAVRDAQGASHAFVYDMDIGSSPTHDPVRAHIRNGTDATFPVVGIKAPAGTFTHDRCRFVYRLR